VISAVSMPLTLLMTAAAPSMITPAASATGITAGSAPSTSAAVPNTTGSVMTANYLDQIPLHDSTVMQGLAHVPSGGWVFSQISQDGRGGHDHAWHLAHGDLTLTRVTATGQITGWMYLQGFGHGHIAVQETATHLWVWSEAVASGGYGTRLTRFTWQPGHTLTSSDVTKYAPNPSGVRHSPSLDAAGGLVADRYTRGGQITVAVYHLADFLRHSYPAIRRITQPSPAAGTSQGSAILPTGRRVAWLTGNAYSDSNPPPGNATLTIYGAGGVISRVLLTDGPGLSYREPEGVTVLADGRVCYGFASGEPGARRASVYCQ